MNSALFQSDIQEIFTRLEDGLGPQALSYALQKKKFLITGGAGFLGRYFLSVLQYCNHYLHEDHKLRVVCVDNFITGEDALSEFLEDPNFRIVKADASQPLDWLALEEGGFDYIVHAAGIASPVYYMKYPLETAEVATNGTHNLLKLALHQPQLERFLFFSTSEIYGDPIPGEVPTSETYRGNVSCTGPRACYDESKRFAETLCTIYQQRGVPITVIRPFNVFGPGMKIDDQRAIPAFVSHGLQGKNLPVHGTGEQTRTFCYITDAMNGFLRALFLPTGKNEIFNIGNGEPEISMLELAREVCVALGAEGKVGIQCIQYPATYPADEPQRRCPDLTKAMTLLNSYTPTVSLKEGLQRTVRWYQQLLEEQK